MSQYDARIKKARAVNRSRSRSEKRAGFAPPEDCAPHIHFETALEAVKAGLKREDWTCVAEGIAMLEDFYSRIAIVPAIQR